MLTPAQFDEFWSTGVVQIPGAFSREEAARMQDVLWAELSQRYGVRRDDRLTWNLHPPTGLTTTKRSKEFAPILSTPVADALDQLFGRSGWRRPKHFGQVLVTMPDPGTSWTVPARLWHTDFPYLGPVQPLFALKFWALFGDAEPGGGSTLQLAGSHLLTERYLEGLPLEGREYKRVRDGMMQSHAFLRALVNGDDGPGRTDRFLQGVEIDGVSIRVVECTGEAGDVYLTHPWVLHAAAPNARDEPRLMRSGVIERAS